MSTLHLPSGKPLATGHKSIHNIQINPPSIKPFHAYETQHFGYQAFIKPVKPRFNIGEKPSKLVPRHQLATRTTNAFDKLAPYAYKPAVRLNKAQMRRARVWQWLQLPLKG